MLKLTKLLTLMLVLAAPARADEVVVFAASSLKTALDEVAQAYTGATGNTVSVSYAGSSQLARQILLGAPADVFLSANVAWMDELGAASRLASGTRADLLGNTLVLIAHDPEAEAVDLTDPGALPDLLGGRHLAMALVDSVPAGIYGRAALEALGMWDGVADQVAQSDNVRAALALVATGAAPYGIVYASDAVAEPRVHAVATFPEDSHPPIIYPVAAIAERERRDVQALLDYLRTAQARALFEAQGFSWVGD